MSENKPMILLWKEFHERILKDINESQLPSFFVESVLQDILRQVQTAVKIDYESALSYYNENKDNNVKHKKDS